MKHHVLLIGLVWPEPNSSAAGVRMLQLIHSFLEQKFIVSFACSAARGEFSYPLENLGVQCYSIILNSSSFDSFIQELAPTMVVFDRYITEEHYGWRVSENCPNALRILDSEDLHCLRKARQKAVNEQRVFCLEDLLVEETAKREIASILRCDITWIISEYEMEVLQNSFKIDGALLDYLPMWVSAAPKIANDISNRANFSFVGNFLHDPNWDALMYLKKEIWPRIRKQLPQAELHVFGAYPAQKVMDLHNPREGFIVKGRAENITQVFENTRVFLAPLRFGAGIKGKLIEAMVHGVPSVTTPIGAESMHGEIPWNGFIEQEVEAFADVAVELYSDMQKWHAAVDNGCKILESRFIKRDNAFIIKLEALYLELELHRKQNFLGNLLQHQQFQATKFMSKWIESKNRSNE
jgi:glycosyltransferase involved in cell wall biosynthesis